MEIHEKLKMIRERKEITQAELGKIIGTTQQQIYKYEKGEQEMTISRLAKLCAYYGVSADYILGLPRGLAWPK